MPQTRPPLPRRYLALLGRDLAARCLQIVLVVEAIYLSDKVLNELLSSTLEFGMGPGFLLQTVLLAMPEILLLGLPPALFTAVALVLYARREAGDFVALQMAGSGPGALIRWLIAAGAGAAVLAVAIGGWLQPLSLAALQSRIDAGRATAAAYGLTTPERFFALPGMMLYSHNAKTGAGGIFAVIDRPGGGFEAVTARSGVLTPMAAQDRLSLDLTGAEVIGLRPDGASLAETYRLEPNQLTLQTSPMLHLSRLQGLPAVLTLPDLLTPPPILGPDRPRAEVLQRLAGALLAGLAPLMAGAALALGRGRVRLVAPVAMMGAVLAAGFLAAPLAHGLSALPLGYGIGGLVLGAAGLGWALALVMARLWAGWTLPARLAG